MQGRYLADSIKVLVVDDEYIIRDWIGMVIERHAGNKIAVEKASSGETALEIILNGNVDIAITDIRMKRLSGLELIEQSKKAGTNTKFILISNYEDFGYAKEALRLGASDYLLKSEISDEDIIQAVERVRSEIESASRISQRNSFDPGDITLKTFISSLITGNSGGADEEWLQKHVMQLHLKLKPENLIVIVFEADQTVDARPASPEFEQPIAGTIKRNIDLWFKDGIYFKAPDSPHTVIFNISSSSNKTAGELLDLFTLRIISEMKSEYDIGISAGIGRSFFGFLRIHDEYENACLALRQRYFTDGCHVGYFLSMDHRRHMNYNNYIQSGMKCLKESLNLWKLEDAARETTALLNQYSGFYVTNIQDVQQGLCRIISLYYDCLNHLGIAEVQMEDLFGNYERRIFSYQFFKYARDYVTSVANAAPRIVANVIYKGNMIEKVIEYIRLNYDQDISLVSLARMFHMSPGHLSKQFKEKAGQNLSKYIVELRIEASKELLKSSDIRVSDIAVQVGFSSLSYFTQAFHRVEGCSPQSYRAKYNK